MSPLANRSALGKAQHQAITRVLKGNDDHLAEIIRSFLTPTVLGKRLRTIPEDGIQLRRAPISDEPAPKRR